MTIFVTPDEHVDEDTGEYKGTNLWQVREDVPGGSEVVDCCLTSDEAIKLAASMWAPTHAQKGG
jgi:hypothetical protein|tara:strand:- start:300 stop:491 length:192 start_codon:yes stop_codon:yes gene_type:complete